MAIYANEVDYWKTGTERTPAQWVEMCVNQLRQHGATDIVQATGEQGGRAAYMLQFSLRGMRHRIVWPVLPLRHQSPANERAAERQAATTLYHEVKWRCVVAARYGDAAGFFQFRQLADGRTVHELSDDELTRDLPVLMSPAAARLELQEGTSDA